MRCIIVADRASYSGGVTAVLCAQARGLAALGCEVHLFAARGPVAAEFGDALTSSRTLSLEGQPRVRIEEVWNRPAQQALDDFLRRFSPHDTIVHVHSVSTGLSSSIAAPLQRSGIPYVVTAHDASWACPTGTFYNFAEGRICGKSPLSVGCVASSCDHWGRGPKLYKTVKTAVLRHASGLLEGAATILAPSRKLLDRLEPFLPAGVPRTVLLNPVEAVDHGPRADPGTGFIFVGRLVQEKGVLELCRASVPDLDVRIVGTGPMQDAMAATGAKLAFTGWLSPAEVHSAIRQARALVLPSLWLEAFGLVVAEALAAGVPVIVSERAGAAELVKDGINGFLVDPSDTAALRERMQVLLDDAVAMRLSEAAYEGYWARPLSTERHCQQLTRLYRLLLGGKASSAVEAHPQAYRDPAPAVPTR